MGSGFSKLKKQAKQFQQEYEKLQEEKRKTLFIGSAGNGLVVVKINGEKELQGVTIHPECASDLEALQDLIVAAYQNAVKNLPEDSTGPFQRFSL